jgi:hypothetical protein
MFDLCEIILFHEVYLLQWSGSKTGFDFAKTATLRHVEHYGESKIAICPSIARPTDSIPALDNLITK